jgi:vancomycin permeability regulator SanA
MAYVAITAVQVWSAAARDEAAPAGAIVVLGAAQYDGRPSPVLRARLDHAVHLYRDGFAPLIVVTGSNKPGDRATEASASAAYLHMHGIADDVIRREVQGTNTYDQVAATRRILRAEGIADAVLVSDPLHSHRLALTARETGLDARVSPRSERRGAVHHRVRTAVRETLAVSAGRIVGFRRLRNLQLELRNGLAEVHRTAAPPAAAGSPNAPRASVSPFLLSSRAGEGSP